MKKTPAQRKKEMSFPLFLCLVAAACALFFLFVARPALVHGPSMENTLRPNQPVLVWQRGYAPKNGDIVVTNNNNRYNTRLVKRIVAVEGQTLAIKNSTVYVDGTPLDEPYLKEKTWLAEDIEILIPQGAVFLMGDNRNESTDSRQAGVFPVSDITGKVVGY